MSLQAIPVNRRSFLAGSTAAVVGAAAGGRASAGAAAALDSDVDDDRALVAISLDLEMARNFPEWDDTHWDYEKGNLNEAAKDYAREACRRIHARGSVVHTFVVGQVFEQENVEWLKEIAAEGHPIGNHTYDHVYLLAKDTAELQYRFQRAPWLLRQMPLADAIRENIKLTNLALKQRVGVEANGFRTPGGFSDGLTGREDLQQMLLDLGFKWASCRYPPHAGIESLHGTNNSPSQEAFDAILAAQPLAQPFVYPTGLIEVPMSPISDIGAFRNGRWRLKHFHDAVRMAVNWTIENQAVFDFLAHPSCLGVVDPKFTTIDLICDLVDRAGDRAAIVDLNALASRARPALGVEAS